MNCTPAGNSVCPYIHTHRALATHSSVASLTPATTVVFRGEITITGGTGSAGASESKQESDGRGRKETFRSIVHRTSKFWSFSLVKLIKLVLVVPQVPQIPTNLSKQTSLTVSPG